MKELLKGKSLFDQIFIVTLFSLIGFILLTAIADVIIEIILLIIRIKLES